jgi:hypothetical protein
MEEGFVSCYSLLYNVKIYNFHFSIDRRWGEMQNQNEWPLGGCAVNVYYQLTAEVKHTIEVKLTSLGEQGSHRRSGTHSQPFYFFISQTVNCSNEREMLFLGSQDSFFIFIKVHSSSARQMIIFVSRFLAFLPSSSGSENNSLPGANG